MATAMIVRRAEHSDARSIATLLEQLGYDATTELVASKLARFEGSPTDAVFVAEGEEGLLGCLSAHAHELFHADGRLGRITSMVVDKDARGYGVGRALVGAAIQLFSDSGCVRVEVTSGDHRPDAHRFYASMGFEEDERRFILRLAH